MHYCVKRRFLYIVQCEILCVYIGGMMMSRGCHILYTDLVYASEHVGFVNNCNILDIIATTHRKSIMHLS